jgi:hypothetical protein
VRDGSDAHGISASPCDTLGPQWILSRLPLTAAMAIESLVGYLG